VVLDADLLLTTAAGMGTAHTGDHHRLADVQRRATLMDDLHDDPSDRPTSTPPTKPSGSKRLILALMATIPGACAGFTSDSVVQASTLVWSKRLRSRRIDGHLTAFAQARTAVG
jgi:hypothetical protein